MQHIFVQRRIPIFLQRNNVECGAACLAMILTYYGHATTSAEISAATGLGRDGLSARSIVTAAHTYGLQTKALFVSAVNLRPLHFPAIAYWEQRHFVIVERWSTQSMTIIDPEQGRLQVTHEEFKERFSQVLILLGPGKEFQRRRSIRKKDTALSSYLARYLKQSPWLFLQILLASFLLQIFGLAIPLFTQSVVDGHTSFKNGFIALLLCISLLLFLFLQGITSYVRARRLAVLQRQVNGHMTAQFFAHLLKLPLAFFQQRSNGDLLSRVASNAQLSDLVSSQVMFALLDSLFIVFDLYILFHQSQLFAYTVVAIGGIEMLLLLAFTSTLQQKSVRELDAFGKHQGYTAEVVNGMSTVKAFGAEKHVLAKWQQLFQRQQHFAIEEHYLAALLTTCIQSLNLLAPFLLLGIGVEQVMQGKMSIGSVVALNILAAIILTPLASLMQSGQQVQTVRAHLARIQDVTETVQEQDESLADTPPTLRGDIRLEQVSFRYHGSGDEILQDITLHIKPGQKVALVGRTGSGKSSLGKLLLGFYPPTQGAIFYDDISLRTLNLQAVRQQMGVVLQEVHIFNGSIRENIAFHDPQMQMTQIELAAQLAALHNDILQLPMGYETIVGEGGSALSGGQRQRLALARALAHQPAILLLDEATSALDIVTEEVIEKNLSTLPCTQIIIAHRLNTIQHVDLIIVLERGRIVEHGSHQQLIQKEGLYAALLQPHSYST